MRVTYLNAFNCLHDTVRQCRSIGFEFLNQHVYPNPDHIQRGANLVTNVTDLTIDNEKERKDKIGDENKTINDK